MNPTFMGALFVKGLLCLSLFFTSCATNPYQSRVGKMTMQESERHLGPADESTTRANGSVVKSWAIPDEFGTVKRHVFTFDATGVLRSATSYYMGNTEPPMGATFDDKFEF